MDIIAARREERQNKITLICSSIKKAQLEGKEINFKGVVMASQLTLGVSKRTAQEYVDLAIFSLGLDKEDLNKIPDEIQSS